MPITQASNFNFSNQQRLEHTSAYFRKYLIWAQFGHKLLQNFDTTPGNQVDIPYFGKMGVAQKPAESAKLDVDSMGDQSFSATVFEAAKAWGITDSARVRMGSSEMEWEEEAAAQAGRRLAELVDDDAVAVLNSDASTTLTGTVGTQVKGHDAIDNIPASITLSTAFGLDKGANHASVAQYRMDISKLSRNLNEGFGDRAKEVNVMIMHSRSHTDLLTNTAAGFLRADANSPYNAMQGYEGMLLGKSVFIIDNIPVGKKVSVTDSASVVQMYNTRKQFSLKPNAYALLLKQDAQSESARDVLKRQDLFSITQWYAFTSLHKRIDSEDIRAVGTTYLTTEQTT